jgi:hypothetical protein
MKALAIATIIAVGVGGTALAQQHTGREKLNDMKAKYTARAQAPIHQLRERSRPWRGYSCIPQYDGSGAPTGPYCAE